MEITDKELFRQNLDYLYSIAKKAGFKKQDVHKEVGIDNSVPYYWQTRGRAGKQNLIKFIKFFQAFIPDLNLDNLLKKDLNQFRLTFREEENDYFTEEEKEIIQRLRRWHIVNRKALIDFIRSVKL